MIANKTQMIEFKPNDSFFDYWHYADIDLFVNDLPPKKSEQIKEKIKAQYICETFPEHCSQLLFLS